MSWREYVSFPWPYLGPIGYNTTTDDATAAFTCVQHMRNRSMRRTSVCFANASALTQLIKSIRLRAVVQKEDVDGVNQYLPWYTPFNLQTIWKSMVNSIFKIKRILKNCHQNGRMSITNLLAFRECSPQ